MSAIASAIAVRYTFLAYKRDQKFHNENFLFQSKYKSYSLIIGSLNRLLTKIQTTLEDMENASEKELNKLSDEIDESIYEFENLISEHSFSMSDKVIVQIETITDLMLIGVVGEADLELNTFLNDIINKSNKLVEKMREELHVDNLTVSLSKRIRAK